MKRVEHLAHLEINLAKTEHIFIHTTNYYYYRYGTYRNDEGPEVI